MGCDDDPWPGFFRTLWCENEIVPRPLSGSVTEQLGRAHEDAGTSIHRVRIDHGSPALEKTVASMPYRRGRELSPGTAELAGVESSEVLEPARQIFDTGVDNLEKATL